MAKQVLLSGLLQFLEDGDDATVEFELSGNTARAYFHDFTVGTVEEQLDVEDIAAIDYAAFRNKDANNYVEIGSATGSYCTLLRATQSSGPTKWNETAVVYAKANTASVRLRALFVDILT